MAEQAGFDLTDEAKLLDRLESWAQYIDKHMINKVFTLLFLVHNDPKSKAFLDWLLKLLTSRMFQIQVSWDSHGRPSLFHPLDAMSLVW